MPHIETTKRVVALFRRLQKDLATPKNINISETLRGNKMPADYGKFMIKEGLLIKTDGGTRGIATYAWNMDKSADTETANKIINKYNELRRNELTKRVGSKKSKVVSLESRLIKIESMLAKIIKNMKIE